MAVTTTALDVFKLAIALMGELGSTGEADVADNKEYKDRTIPILNILKGELFPLSDTYTIVTAGKRPVCATISDFTAAIGIDDVISQSVMPYGLAAQLLLDENPSMANFFQQKYEELKSRLATAPAEFSAIENVYGGIENCEFSGW